MKSFLYGLAVLTIIFGMTAPAAAQKPDRNKQQRRLQENQRQRPADRADWRKSILQRLDADGNGTISLAEVPERLRPRLVQLDSDGDGNLAESELKSAFQNRAGDRQQPGARNKIPGGGADKLKLMFQRIDQDGNGSISQQEAPERMKERFAQIDTDGDGQIDAREFQVVVERMGGQRGDQAGKQGRRGDGAEATRPQRPKRPVGDGK